jgi:hypothetical protein
MHFSLIHSGKMCIRTYRSATHTGAFGADKWFYSSIRVLRTRVQLQLFPLQLHRVRVYNTVCSMQLHFGCTYLHIECIAWLYTPALDCRSRRRLCRRRLGVLCKCIGVVVGALLASLGQTPHEKNPTYLYSTTVVCVETTRPEKRVFYCCIHTHTKFPSTTAAVSTFVPKFLYYVHTHVHTRFWRFFSHYFRAKHKKSVFLRKNCKCVGWPWVVAWVEVQWQRKNWWKRH